MSQLTPNTRISLATGAALTIAGGLLYAGWFANGLLRDIKDEIGAIRTDIKSASTDRWTGRDMRDWGTQAERLNATVQRTDGKTGLILPDVHEIQRANRSDR